MSGADVQAIKLKLMAELERWSEHGPTNQVTFKDGLRAAIEIIDEYEAQSCCCEEHGGDCSCCERHGELVTR